MFNSHVGMLQINGHIFYRLYIPQVFILGTVLIVIFKINVSPETNEISRTLILRGINISKNYFNYVLLLFLSKFAIF